MSASTPSRILDSALVALLQGLQLSPWIKVPATFIAELSKRFSTLPDEEKKGLQLASPGDIASSLSAHPMAPDSSPQTEVLARAIDQAIARSLVLDYLYALTSAALNELISRIDGARPNVSETAPKRTQVAQFIEWVESAEGPGIPKIKELLGLRF
jgi:hypothetical protein